MISEVDDYGFYLHKNRQALTADHYLLLAIEKDTSVKTLTVGPELRRSDLGNIPITLH